jgi:biotin transport system substrate-specific component
MMSQHVESVAANGAISVAATPSLALTILRDGGIVLAASALVAVCAHVSIPLFFTPVPVTLQPFAVVLLGLLLSPRLAFGAMVAYLAEGAAGLPVFTPSGPGGMLQLFGLTGGYLLSYPVVAPLVAMLWRRGARSFSRGLVVAGVGSAVTLAMGAGWLGLMSHAGLVTLMSQSVIPFLPGDVLKVVAAAGVASSVSKMRRFSANEEQK